MYTHLNGSWRCHRCCWCLITSATHCVFISPSLCTYQVPYLTFFISLAGYTLLSFFFFQCAKMIKWQQGPLYFREPSSTTFPMIIMGIYKSPEVASVRFFFLRNVGFLLQSHSVRHFACLSVSEKRGLSLLTLHRD